MSVTPGFTAYQAKYFAHFLTREGLEDGDGLTATRAIRARDATARIVIVTQFDQEELRCAAAEVGAVAYMLKENLLSIRRFLLADTSPS